VPKGLPVVATGVVRDPKSMRQDFFYFKDARCAALLSGELPRQRDKRHIPGNCVVRDEDVLPRLVSAGRGMIGSTATPLQR
jgi:hypothetical protein